MRYSVVVKKDRFDQTRHSRLQRCRLRKNQLHSPLSSPKSLYSNDNRGWTSSPTLLYDLIPTNRLKHQLQADSPGANHSGSGIRHQTRRLGESSRQGRKSEEKKSMMMEWKRRSTHIKREINACLSLRCGRCGLMEGQRTSG